MISNDLKPFVFGGVSSVTAELCTFPLDTVKTRLQIQGQKIDIDSGKLPKYRGIVHCFVSLCKEEGYLGVYNGIKPAILRQITYGTMRIGFYQTCKRNLLDRGFSESLHTNALCAAFSGGLANGIANPTDLLKIRLQVNRDSYRNVGMFRAFYDILKKEKFRGLYRGIVPNMQRAAVITSFEMPVYDVTKRFLLDYFSLNGEHYATHLLASSFSGFTATLAATPIDVVKSRLMNQKNLKDRQNKIYKGSIDCILQTVKYEGFFALYKGFLASFLRLAPWNIIFFMTYEQLKNYDSQWLEK